MDLKEHVSLSEHLVDQEWFNALLDSSLDCIIAINHDDIVVEFNRAAEIVFGYSAAEAIRSARPYRNAKGIAAALDEITRWPGIKYDAAAVEACRRLIVEQGFDIDINAYTSTNFVDLAFMKVEKALG